MKLKRDEKGRVIPLTIPDDLGEMGRAILMMTERTGVPVRTLVIDPITAYLPDTIHYGNDAQVRKAMLPLKQFAEDHNLAVVLIRHLNKDGGLRSLYRGGGSIAFTAAARSVLVVEKHPDDDGSCVLAQVKGNLGPPVPSITYRLVADVDHDAPRIEWGEEIRLTADQLLSPDARREAPARKEAEQFLLDLLKDGPVGSKTIHEAAKEAGHSLKTVRAAKQVLGVRAERETDETGKTTGWRWLLPVYRTDDGNYHFNLEGRNET
jgi:hypothetical protein